LNLPVTTLPQLPRCHAAAAAESETSLAKALKESETSLAKALKESKKSSAKALKNMTPPGEEHPGATGTCNPDDIMILKNRQS
jgi:hypothetical protein